MDKLPYISFSDSQKKENKTWLEWHKSEQTLTEFPFLGELFL